MYLYYNKSSCQGFELYIVSWTYIHFIARLMDIIGVTAEDTVNVR